jgi:transcriptional regulator with XRE-family HTH domain
MNQLLGRADELGEAIRDARTRLGLSQAELAKRIGVARMTISRLERGDEVSMATALDASRTCGLVLATTETRGWLTAYEHSRAIAGELERGDHNFALRLLRQGVEDLEYLIAKDDERAIAQFLARTPTMDDARWESLFALAIAQACERHQVNAPSWARAEPLAEPFFPSRPSRRFIGQTVDQTMPTFAEANVWIDSRDLTYA